MNMCNGLPTPCKTIKSLKHRPNDRNISTQYSATLLGNTCCEHLATLLRHVGCCCLKFETGPIFHTTFVDAACMMLVCATMLHPGMRTSLFFSTQHVGTRRNRVAKRALNVAPNNVAICCVQMLLSFGRSLNN